MKATNNQNYEKVKAEHWEQFWHKVNGSINRCPETYEDLETAFYTAFDRAYALGKEKEAISQEDIEKGAREAVRKEYLCESCAWKDDCDLCGGENTAFDCCECPADSYEDGFKDGADFALGKQEKDAEGEEMLTVSRKRLMDAFNSAKIIGSSKMSSKMLAGAADMCINTFKDLFGSKCLPDDDIKTNTI